MTLSIKQFSIKLSMISDLCLIKSFNIMYLRLTIVCWLLVVLLSLPTRIYTPDDSLISLHGRYYKDGNGINYDWPCFRIQFCFKNASKVNWLVEDGFSHYQIILNEEHSTQIIPKKQTKITIYDSSASQKINCISIAKITQDHFGPLGTRKDSIFKGIQLVGQGSQLVQKEEAFKYRLEFLGDSLTVAFGDMSGTNPVCFLRMRHNENCLFSWAVQLSKSLNSDYRLMAQSGKGAYKNAPGVPGPPMSDLFSRITSNSKRYSYKYQDGYAADAVIILIGGNDFSNLIKPHQDNFVAAYKEMLRQITADHIRYLNNYPKIINICEFGKTLCYYVRQAVSAFRFGYEKTYYVEMPGGTLQKGNFGCIGHPNVEGQTRIAKAVLGEIKKILEE